MMIQTLSLTVGSGTEKNMNGSKVIETREHLGQTSLDLHKTSTIKLNLHHDMLSWFESRT